MSRTLWSRWRGAPDAPAMNRRAFLGGAAAAITLPFLPSLLPRAARADGAAPVRLVFWFVPNGIHMPAWTPTTEGAGFALPRILAPLAGVRDHVNVISGLRNDGGYSARPGDHARGTGSFLTCTEPDFAGVQNGISVDQVAAQALGHHTTFPSLQLGTENGTNIGGCDSGYSCAYVNNISWAGPVTPLPKIASPQLVFDRLFAGLDRGISEAERLRRLQYRSSVLDHASDDAIALQRVLGNDDRNRLDEYLTGVRELEQRLAGGASNACLPPSRPADGDVEGNIDTMSELTAVALSCNLTRFVTFMLANGGSNRSHAFLGAPGAHHEISHHQDLPENLEKLTLINTWEVERLGVLLRHLRDVPEGDGTLLDNTLVMFGSDVSDGNRHNHDDLPILLAGGGGGTIPGGRHLRANDEACDKLFVSMLRAAGVDTQSFGPNGRGELAGLRA